MVPEHEAPSRHKMRSIPALFREKFPSFPAGPWEIAGQDIVAALRGEAGLRSGITCRRGPRALIDGLGKPLIIRLAYHNIYPHRLIQINSDYDNQIVFNVVLFHIL